MKKTYQTPVSNQYVVNACAMIAESPGQTEIIVDPDQPPVGDDDDNYVKSSRGGLFGGNDWDE